MIVVRPVDLRSVCQGCAAKETIRAAIRPDGARRHFERGSKMLLCLDCARTLAELLWTEVVRQTPEPPPIPVRKLRRPRDRRRVVGDKLWWQMMQPKKPKKKLTR